MSLNGGRMIIASWGDLASRISGWASSEFSATANSSELRLTCAKSARRDAALAQLLDQRVAHHEKVVLGLVEDVRDPPLARVERPANDVRVGDQRQVMLDLGGNGEVVRVHGAQHRGCRRSATRPLGPLAVARMAAIRLAQAVGATAATAAERPR